MSEADLVQDLRALSNRFDATPRPGGRGQMILFASAREDAPRRRVARGFAELLSGQVRRAAWLIDLDLANNPHAAALAARDKLAGPFDLGLGRDGFWRVEDQGRPVAAGRGAMQLFKVGRGGLFVSRFRGDAISAGSRVRLVDAPGYWRAARLAADVIVVDAPARGRSTAALIAARHATGVVLVVDNAGPALQEARALKAELERAGGRVAGAVLVERDDD